MVRRSMMVFNIKRRDLSRLFHYKIIHQGFWPAKDVIYVFAMS